MAIEQTLSDVFNDAAGKIGAATAAHWPTKIWDPNATHSYTELPEAMVTSYLTVAFAARGFHVYCEVPLELPGANGRVDMVAVGDHGGTRVVVGLEAKRLFAGGGAGSIAQDWTRLSAARWARGVTLPDPRGPGTLFIPAVSATTWKPDIAEWWAAGLRAPPGRRRAPGFGALAYALAGTRCWATTIATSPGGHQQWLLAAAGLP